MAKGPKALHRARREYYAEGRLVGFSWLGRCPSSAPCCLRQNAILFTVVRRLPFILSGSALALRLTLYPARKVQSRQRGQLHRKCVPTTQYQRCDPLPLGEAIWADGPERGQAAQGGGTRERKAQKMPTESLLKNSVREAVCEKNGKRGGLQRDAHPCGRGPTVFWESGMPVLNFSVNIQAFLG